MAHFTRQKAAKLINPGTITLAVIVVGLLIFLGTSFYIVNEAEEAVITRFGKYHTTTGSGLRFKLPFGIDKTYIVNVKEVQTEQFGFKTLRAGINTTYSGDINM